MQHIHVEPARLEETALRIEQNEEDYSGLIRELYSKVDKLSGAWQGKDNVAFVAQIRSYEEDLNQISLIMRQYADFLRNSARAYSETQQELATEARHIF